MAKGTGEEFVTFTQYQYLEPSDQQRRLPQPPLELPPDVGEPLLRLPKPADIAVPPVGLRQAIEGRESLRQYGPQPLALAELAFLLWCSQGVRQVLQGRVTLRNVPSAGARHALETYVLANRVEGLESGLYRYLAVEHALQLARGGPEVAEQLVGACLGQAMVAAANASLYWTAVPYRMTWRYGERGYRYLFLDAGHACQNLYLAAEAVGCGACAIAAFDDELLNAALGIDGVEQFALYVATVGKKP